MTTPTTNYYNHDEDDSTEYIDINGNIFENVEIPDRKPIANVIRALINLLLKCDVQPINYAIANIKSDTNSIAENYVITGTYNITVSISLDELQSLKNAYPSGITQVNIGVEKVGESKIHALVVDVYVKSERNILHQESSAFISAAERTTKKRKIV